MPSMPMISPDPSMHDSSSSDSPTLSDGRRESATPLPRKPIPRKGHTKSRRGCFNCKRRRIKCNERHPECDHCIKAGLHCEYPANIIQATQRSTTSPHPREVGNLRSTPGMFVSILRHTTVSARPNQYSPWPTCDYSTTSSSPHIHICLSGQTRSGSQSYQVLHIMYVPNMS
jgi:hypothetical protein